MPFSENSMGQVRTIWDFCRLNVMATLKYRISEFLGGFFFYKYIQTSLLPAGKRKESQLSVLDAIL